MNPSPNNGSFSQNERRNYSGEDTLRLIASLPAPQGLTDRVHAGLRSAPESSRVLPWRDPLRSAGGWMYTTVARSAAAAAIVCVVAGGGWSVYSHVQPAPATNVIAVPPQVTPARGGFSPANARHVPLTLQGPVLTHPVQAPADENVVDKMPAPARAVPASPRAKRKKAASPAVPAPVQ